MQYKAALALALTGDEAQALADDLRKHYPEDTIVQFAELPTLHAQLALGRNDASKAIDALQAAAPYELGIAAGLHPIYVRGEAYLTAHDGSKAAGEFQKIIDHRVFVLNPIELSPISVLPAPMCCKATLLKPRRHIKISSRSGRTPTSTPRS